MTAAGVYDAMVRHRRVVLGGLVLGVAAGVVGASRLRIDMSFRPTFIGDKAELACTGDHERVFGQVGFRDLVAIADVGDASDPRAIARVAGLAERLRRIPSVIEVRDPASFPFFDRRGEPQARGIAGALPPVVAMFTMAFTLASDVVLAPALYLLLRPRRVAAPAPVALPAADASTVVAPVLA